MDSRFRGNDIRGGRRNNKREGAGIKKKNIYNNSSSREKITL